MSKILILLTFALLILLLIHPVDNADIWMHIKTGQLILENSQIPSTDIYSYTAEGKRWLNHQWLSQVIFYMCYIISGVNGLIFLQVIVIFLAFLLLFKNTYRAQRWLLSIILILLVILFTQERFLVRPLIFSLFLYSLYNFVLHRYKYVWKGRKEITLYILIPLQILWVNLHAASVMGIFLIWAYITGEFIDNHLRRNFDSEFSITGYKYRRLLYTGLLMLILSGLTPYGYNAILFPFRQIRGMYYIYEWGPSVQNDILLNAGIMPYYRLFILISFIVFIFRGRFISSAHIIMFSALLYLSLSHRRHLPLYGIAIAPLITTYSIGFKFKRLPEYVKKFFVRTVSVMLMLFLILTSREILAGEYYPRKGMGLKFGLGRLGYPDKAVDFLARSGIEGNMFNDYGSGCFLIWRLYPQRKVFIDGRNTIYGTRFIKESYIEPLLNPVHFERLVRQYNINYVFLHYALSLGNVAGIIRYLYYNKGWALVYFDDRACIFVRNTGRNMDIISRYRVDLLKREKSRTVKAHKEGIFFKDCMNRSAFYEKLGFIDIAIQILKDAIRVEPDIGDLHYNLGTLYLKKELWPDAVREFKEAVEYRHNDADAYNNLGIAYAKMGKFKEAIDAFRKVLYISPFHKYARRNMKIAEGDYKRQKRARE